MASYTVNSSPNNGYIALPVTVDANTLAQNAIQSIAAQLPGWKAYESNIEVMLLEKFASMTSDSAQVAANVPLAIFNYFGTLIGINQLPGSPATTTTTWTFQNASGYSLPAGTQLGFQVAGNQLALFQTLNAISVPAGETVATGVQIVAYANGSQYNGIAAGPMKLVTPLSYVASVVSTAPTTGGSDPETQAAYLNRLASELQYLAPRPILPADFAGIATNVTGVFRALAVGGLSPGRTISGAALTSASPTLTCATANFTQFDVGRSLTGTAIPSSTTISSIPNSTVASASNGASLPASTITLASASGWPSSGTATFQLTANSYTVVSYTGISGAELTGCTGGSGTLATGMVAYCGSQCTMSHNATSNETSESVVLGDLTNQERTVAVCAVDDLGNTLSTSVQDALQSYLLAKRETNFVVNMMDPTYSAIDITYMAYCTPTSDPATVTSAITSSLTDYLSQANWGGGNASPPTWDSSATTVRYNAILALIGSVPGVQYVSSMTMGIHGNAQGTVDVNLPGDAPLTMAGAFVGSVVQGT